MCLTLLQFQGSNKGSIMSWRTGLGAAASRDQQAFEVRSPLLLGREGAASERVCASSRVPSVLHGGQDGECIIRICVGAIVYWRASLFPSQASVPEERFGTVTLLLTPHVPLLLLLASVGKELRFHLYFLAETDPISRPLCAGGEKGKVDVPTHRDREPWCTLEVWRGGLSPSASPGWRPEWMGAVISGVTKHSSGSWQIVKGPEPSHSFSGPWQALRPVFVPQWVFDKYLLVEKDEFPFHQSSHQWGDKTVWPEVLQRAIPCWSWNAGEGWALLCRGPHLPESHGQLRFIHELCLSLIPSFGIY